MSTQVQHFLGCEVRQQFVDIVAVALSGYKLSCGDIEKSDTYLMLIKMQTGNPVILFLR